MRKAQAGTKSVWRAFKQDVPINIGTEDNVITRSVYVIVKTEDQRATVIERLGKEGIKNVTVILKEEGKLERKFLKELRGIQEPSAWKVEWERGNPIDKLFTNFILDKSPVKEPDDSDSSDSDWT